MSLLLRRVAAPSWPRLLPRALSTHIYHSEFPPAALPTESIFGFLRQRGGWDDAGDKVAIKCLSTGRVLTYAELPRRVSGVAHALAASGFQRRDVLNIHLHNTEQYVVAFLAVSALGGTVTTSNPVYTAASLPKHWTPRRHCPIEAGLGWASKELNICQWLLGENSELEIS